MCLDYLLSEMSSSAVQQLYSWDEQEKINIG